MKTNIEQLNAIKSFLYQTSRTDGKSVLQIRHDMAESVKNIMKLPNIQVEPEIIGELKGEWVHVGELNSECSHKVILYFHGGGFVAGTSEFHRDLTARIAQASGVRVLSVDYRLAPEYPYPAANEDCLYAYRWLQAHGYSASDIVIGGDSVGGSLALMTMITLREGGEELPAGAFLLSPHTDLIHLDGQSYESRVALDPTGSLLGNQRILNDYLGDYVGDKPEILSPLRMNLQGLPGILIQVGDHEVLLSDATRFSSFAQKSGVDVKLEVWENMWSVFQFLAALLPEAQQAITHIGQYVRRTLSL